jgi:hypothetical protein
MKRQWICRSGAGEDIGQQASQGDTVFIKRGRRPRAWRELIETLAGRGLVLAGTGIPVGDWHNYYVLRLEPTAWTPRVYQTD